VHAVEYADGDRLAWLKLDRRPASDLHPLHATRDIGRRSNVLGELAYEIRKFPRPRDQSWLRISVAARSSVSVTAGPIVNWDGRVWCDGEVWGGPDRTTYH
jgi:hypothetical protein